MDPRPRRCFVRQCWQTPFAKGQESRTAARSGAGKFLAVQFKKVDLYLEQMTSFLFHNLFWKERRSFDEYFSKNKDLKSKGVRARARVFKKKDTIWPSLLELEAQVLKFHSLFPEGLTYSLLRKSPLLVLPLLAEISTHRQVKNVKQQPDFPPCPLASPQPKPVTFSFFLASISHTFLLQILISKSNLRFWCRKTGKDNLDTEAMLEHLFKPNVRKDLNQGCI